MFSWKVKSKEKFVPHLHLLRKDLLPSHEKHSSTFLMFVFFVSIVWAQVGFWVFIEQLSEQRFGVENDA